jgi:hypothetical protein
MKVHKVVLAVIGLSLCLVYSVASAKFYRCMKGGVEVFSDRACGTNAKDLKIKGHKPTKHVASEQTETAYERQKKYLDAISEERAFEKQQQTEAGRQEAAIKKNCEIARANLKTYQGRGIMYEETKDGGRKYLSDEERAAGLATSQKQVDQFCK